MCRFGAGSWWLPLSRHGDDREGLGMAKLVSIRDWDDHFECSQSRKVAGPLKWFSMPTKHDGKSFRRIMARTDGPMIYAAWVLMLAVAAKATVRGRLADADGPLSAADLELKTGLKASHFETAVKVLSSKEIGWLLVEEWERTGSTLPPQDTTGQDITPQDTTGHVCSEPPAASEPPVLTFPTVGESPEWVLTHRHVADLRESFPTLEVLAECRKALGWLNANQRRRKTPKGMPQFLFGWMSRSQNRGQGGSFDSSDPRGTRAAAEEFLEMRNGNR